ncbi:hypothetical protein ACFU44_06010 [Nocardia rhizosphaerihabitans]|uniref:hypothetical protein n=1 Tax=Nocardia rhizosphaerihabitans TaxID=1691570 RepID=UPI003671F75C
MFEPTPIQAKLLKGIQNLASDDHHLIANSRTPDGPELAPTALAHLDVSRRTREELEAVAAAVGVPGSVIAYTRAAGERGHRWRPGQPLLSSEVIDRDTLLAGHRRSVWQLQQMAGIGAAIARQGSVAREGFEAFRRVMGVSWQRVGALGHVLDLTATEREYAWEPTARPWTERVAEAVGKLEPDVLTGAWRGIVETNFVTVAIPVSVLTAAGVTADDISTQLPVLPDRMVELAAAAMQPHPTLEAAFGADIGAAIEATATGTHTAPDPDDGAGPVPDRLSEHDLGHDP